MFTVLLIVPFLIRVHTGLDKTTVGPWIFDIMTTWTSSETATVGFTLDDSLPGLTMRTRFPLVTQFTGGMMNKTSGSVKVTIATLTPHRWSCAWEIVCTIGPSSRLIVFARTRVVSGIVCIKPLFTIDAPIRAVDKGWKRRTAIVMVVRFEQPNLMWGIWALKDQKQVFGTAHDQKLVVWAQHTA